MNRSKHVIESSYSTFNIHYSIREQSEINKLIMDLQQQLNNLSPEKEFFIGIDSDGCVFGSMEPKQKEFFCPNVLKHYGLFPIANIARETWEFVNLYSQTRGINRFLALITCFELLKKRKDVIERDFKVPDLSALKKWTENETRLGNPALEIYAGKVNDPDIDLALTWSRTINSEIKQWLDGIVPFAFVRESLDKIGKYADAMVVSQTPLEALTREWTNHDLTKFVHDMKVTLPSGEVARIDELHRGCIVLKESQEGFKVNSNIMETFDILSNASLRETIRDMRKKGSKSKPYEPLTY